MDDEDIDMGSTPAPTATFVEDPLSNDTTMTQLMRHWMNERNAPDILPAEEILLATLLDHVRRQVSLLKLELLVEWLMTGRQTLSSFFGAILPRQQRKNTFESCLSRQK